MGSVPASKHHMGSSALDLRRPPGTEGTQRKGRTGGEVERAKGEGKKGMGATRLIRTGRLTYQVTSPDWQ